MVTTEGSNSDSVEKLPESELRDDGIPIPWKSCRSWNSGIPSISGLILVIYYFNLNKFYSQFIFSTGINLSIIAYFLIVTPLIAVFPVTFSIFLAQNRQLARNLKTITEMNNQLNSSFKRNAIRAEEAISIAGSAKVSFCSSIYLIFQFK